MTRTQMGKIFHKNVEVFFFSSGPHKMDGIGYVLATYPQ